MICDDTATLVYLGNQACITPHIWLSQADKLKVPDQMIFDLDPSTEDLAAHWLKETLEEMALPAYVKSTGSRELHVVAPLAREHNFASVRAVARQIATIVVNCGPAGLTMEQYKNKRHGGYSSTAIAMCMPDSGCPLRAARDEPVAVPLDWRELRRKNFRPDGVAIRTIFARLEKIEDAWRDFLAVTARGKGPAEAGTASHCLIG